jgi:hydroxyethylthiazole kinase-like uncharacterized protein yjeF
MEAMKILTANEMRETDRATTEHHGVTRAELMENAGAAVARFALTHWPKARRIVVICGRGNNGGDGFVAARHLRQTGRQVSVMLLGEPGQLQGEAADNLARLKTASIRITKDSDLEHREVSRPFSQADLFVDAVYGTGFHPPLDELSAAVKAKLDAMSHTPVLAVDLPSGWDADSREMHNAGAFRADAVVTFTAPKIAHAFGYLSAGPSVVAPIGTPDEAISESKLTWTGSSVSKFQAPRNRDGNKGQYGHVMVIGGSRGKAGAPSMASLAAMRVGAGLTTAAVAASILPTVARVAPELMTHELAETQEGEITAANAAKAKLDALLHKITVLALGPGLGQSSGTQKFVHEVVANTTLPLVLDADGLNAFDSSHPGRDETASRMGHPAPSVPRLNGGKRTLVLTPHPGEMARLLGSTVKAVEADREIIARRFATEHDLILVLKGWRTLVAHPDGRVAVNTTGNPGMAKGGSGDVLTGLIAGMMAQAKQYGATAGEAVEAAVFLHGLAADIAVAEGDEHTFLPTDLLRFLPNAFQFRASSSDALCWLQGYPGAPSYERFHRS